MVPNRGGTSGGLVWLICFSCLASPVNWAAFSLFYCAGPLSNIFEFCKLNVQDWFPRMRAVFLIFWFFDDKFSMSLARKCFWLRCNFIRNVNRLTLLRILTWLAFFLICSRILGTLICIWNNGRRYSICCFTVLHTTISLSYRCLGNIWMLSQIVDNLHVDRYWILYHVPECDMGYFSIIVWGGTSTFLDGYLGSNLQMWKCNDFMDCFTSYNIFQITFFLFWKKND